METYEVILKGFDGSSDETDHLILWVTAPSIERVSQCFGNAQEIHEMDKDYAPSFALDLQII